MRDTSPVEICSKSQTSVAWIVLLSMNEKLIDAGAALRERRPRTVTDCWEMADVVSKAFFFLVCVS